jgi:SpoVK/Ycf46/Vps4 family AAA+-type ATPase
MEKVQGIGWYEKDALHLKEKGYTDEDIEALKRQAEEQMLALQARFEEAGIERGWKLKDMIFDIDIESKTIRGITPVDWERTKINKEKLEAYKKSKT